jgi:signal transduction histidine kinase/CheY-like chemotaxis protein
VGSGRGKLEGGARIAALERRSEETQQLANVGTWEWLIDDERGWKLTWSPQMQRLFGRDPDGPPPTDEELLAIVHPDDRQQIKDLVDKIRSAPGPFQCSYRIVDGSGEVRHLQARGEVEQTDEGHPRRAYGITQDVSELRRSQAQLERAQRLESLGQLAGGVAHDFNNLLSVILNNAECLGDEVEGEVAERVGEIESAALCAADLTRRLLLFSRRDLSKLETIDLGSAVREAEPLLRRTIGDHIELRVNAPAGLPPVRLASGQVEQILVNLVVNARDALPKGGTVSVTVARVPSIPILMLRVADDGVGMSHEVAEKAFDPFFTTKPREQGTGLGLAAVYGIAGRAGGHVEIESEPGQGTAVAVYLPVAERETVDARGPDRAAPPSGAGRTVLVVDNEEPVQRIVAHMLAKHGYRARSASSAREAESLLAEHGDEVDLLLTDVLMPEVSGRELVARLRQRGLALPTIFMSGYGEDPAPLGPWEEDATVLQKPFKAEQLLRAVGEALGAAEEGR